MTRNPEGRHIRWSACILAFVLFTGTGFLSPAQVRRPAAAGGNTPQSIPAAEFSRLIQEFSEADGSFPSDNFVSNENSYLQILDKLRELKVSGGAYIGVGPEQNFTYIAKIRPRIAFIIDIRRQALIQHLLYKAIFDQAKSRSEFISLLLSRPLPQPAEALDTAPTGDMIEYFSKTEPKAELFVQNLQRARRIIEQKFQIHLSDQDAARLEYCYTAFRDNGITITYGSGNNGWPGAYGKYPTLAELVLQADPQGNLENFPASDEDYRFIRYLQKENRIIPLVGDFAGLKALTSVGRYLTKNGYDVSAFYTSNVEQYLFQNSVFGEFVENIYRLPVNENSLFIRSVPELDQEHPAHMTGFGMTTILQQVSVFLDDQETALYDSYWDLVTRHYIVGSTGCTEPARIGFPMFSAIPRETRGQALRPLNFDLTRVTDSSR